IYVRFNRNSQAIPRKAPPGARGSWQIGGDLCYIGHMSRTRSVNREKRTPQHAHPPKRDQPRPSGDDLGAAELARNVALAIRERRKNRSMSLDDLAAASGVSRAALSQIETFKTNPTLGILWKIAVGLGVPFGELIGASRQSVGVLRRSDARILR